MFQTEELLEVILHAGDKERKAEPRAQATKGDLAVAALAPVPQNYLPLH